ncbi:Glyoxylase, beta-lactamase superfamily II [Massilia sp. PDC64]|nr:MBL fold metallo-hydrolase [Massilia sp. PDC64]SDD51927.1 Glyoxylase, beta-lactamase superfamily II [Massilia sp. PDC64]
MHTLDLGAFRLTSLDDGSFPVAAAVYFANVPDVVRRRELATDLNGCIEVGHNCGLIDTGGERVLVDTGYGDDTHGGRTGRLVDELDRAGIAPDDVTIVVNTHAHGDHAGRNTIHGVPAFPRARYFLASADWDHFSARADDVHHVARNFGIPAAHGMLTLFDGPLELAPGIHLLPTPGHTPGHTSVLVSLLGRTALCLGDVCHHPLHVAHPDWVSAFDVDAARNVETRRWLFALAYAREAVILCPHAPAPGFGRLRRQGTGYAWVPLQS